VGVISGVAVSRKTRLGRRERRIVGLLFAAIVAATLFSIGVSTGNADFSSVPWALAYSVAAGFGSVAAAWLALRLLPR
jgi:high-affinity Fe2+/Pb2+ permease